MAKIRTPKLSSRLLVEGYMLSVGEHNNGIYYIHKNGEYLGCMNVSPVCVHDFADGIDTYVPYDISIDGVEADEELPIELFKKAFLVTAKIK